VINPFERLLCKDRQKESPKVNRAVLSYYMKIRYLKRQGIHPSKKSAKETGMQRSWQAQDGERPENEV
jgi:hypothetical protein